MTSAVRTQNVTSVVNTTPLLLSRNRGRRLVRRIADASGAIEPHRTVGVSEHDPHLRVRIDAGVRLVCKKAPVFDSEPWKAAKQRVGLNASTFTC